jgi:hypothetical protein
MEAELDYLLARSATERIRTYYGAEAMNQRIMEWLDTPEGSVADMPEWGHPLFRFKHEPDSPSLQVLAETLLARKMRQDIEDLDLKRIRVEFSDIDHLHITVEYGDVGLERDVAL